MKKTSHNSTRDKKKAKDFPLFMTPKTILETWREIDKGEKWVENLCQHQLEWRLKETSIDFIDFYTQYGLSHKTYHNYRKRYDMLKATHEITKEIIGARREKLALYRKYNCDPKTVHMTLRKYHPVWEEVYEENKKDKENEASTFVGFSPFIKKTDTDK